MMLCRMSSREWLRDIAQDALEHRSVKLYGMSSRAYLSDAVWNVNYSIDQRCFIEFLPENSSVLLHRVYNNIAAPVVVYTCNHNTWEKWRKTD